MTRLGQYSGESTEYESSNTFITVITRLHQIAPAVRSHQPEKAATLIPGVQYLSFNITERIITCMLQY